MILLPQAQRAIGRTAQGALWVSMHHRAQPTRERGAFKRRGLTGSWVDSYLPDFVRVNPMPVTNATAAEE